MRAAPLLLVLAACGGAPDVEPLADALVIELGPREHRLLARLSPLGPPPPDPTNRMADDPAAARLGHWLFYDARLSTDGSVSCATCHQPDHGFAHPDPIATGLERGERHAPTLVNVAHHRWFGWGGRADSLWSQALGPLVNPVEMGGSPEHVADLIRDDPALAAAYADVFGPLPEDGGPRSNEVVFVNVGKAIAAFERLLVRGDSRFDRFVEGVQREDAARVRALSPAEQRGLAVFLGPANCTQCHLGPNFSDGEFHNTAAPPVAGGRPDDPGRFQGARLVQTDPFGAGGVHSDARDGEAAERVRHLVTSSETFGAFQTPGLRNLADHPPYMHQGQFPDLESVVRFYDTREGASVTSHHQEQVLAPLGLTEEQVTDLVAFLGTLEGAPLDAAWLSAPQGPRLGR